MLGRSLVFAGVFVVLATQVPTLFHKDAAMPAPPSSPVRLPSPAQGETAVYTHGNVELRADARGQYNGDFKINGKTVAGLVDTGASYVSLNETTARRLGYSVGALDFRIITHTANGQGKAAFVKLDRVEIGDIRVHDVDALVLRDASLETTLIGVSFLKRLASYHVQDGALSLEQ